MKQHNRLTIFILLFLCIPGLLTIWPSGDQLYATWPINPASQANGSNPNRIGTERIVIQPQEAAGFMDGFWQEKMLPLQIPGAVFVLVQDGQIVFSKGYGLADIEQGKVADPAQTLFAVGSVSKAVTAGAVLQLVEGGQLELLEPVNSYLKSFQIEKTCDAPVTTSHLLTHTAGFDERVIGAFVLSPDEMVPLADYVARDLPPCIRPPGQEMSYCNHCYGLAGLLVEEISGIPFADYVTMNLFKPLEMKHSSFQQPLPSDLAGQRATGYLFAPQIEPAPLAYGNFYPSGGLWATSEDMGRLIVGYLQGGLPGGETVFGRETLNLLQQRQFSQDPRLEGWTYGFFEHFENGQRLIGKDGDSPGFSSMLYLMPENNLGFFLSFNATVPARPGVVDPRLVFPSRFLERFFPVEDALEGAAATMPKPTGIAPKLAGFYRWSRFSHTSIDKVISPMLLLQWRVHANPDGSVTLRYPSLLGGQTSTWIETGPGLYQNLENEAFLVYKQDNRGRISHIYTKITEEGVLERVSWYETLAFQGFLLVFMFVIFLIELIFIIVHALRRRLTNQGTSTEEVPIAGDKITRQTRLTSGLLAGLNLFFLCCLVLIVVQSLTVRAPQMPAYLPVLLVIPLATAGLAVLLLGWTAIGWAHRSGTIWIRFWNTLVTLAGLAFTWFAWYWNILGYSL